MKFLIEIEGPGVDKPTPGETDPEAQIQSFVKALFKGVPGAKVSIVRAWPDDVLVRTDALLRLQSKATVLRWLVEGSDADISKALEEGRKLLKGEK